MAWGAASQAHRPPICLRPWLGPLRWIYYWLFLAIFILGGAWNTESLDLIEVNSVSWYLLAVCLGCFPQKKKTLQKTQRAKTLSAVGLFHSQETATRVSHGRSESLRQAWSWSSDMLVRNSSKDMATWSFLWLQGCGIFQRIWPWHPLIETVFFAESPMFPSQMFKAGKAKIWFFGERSDCSDAPRDRLKSVWWLELGGTQMWTHWYPPLSPSDEQADSADGGWNASTAARRQWWPRNWRFLVPSDCSSESLRLQLVWVGIRNA